jgi:two-component system, cell cycle sensor histidine kinase and response regulator CckA
MTNPSRTDSQLVEEISALKLRIKELEQSETNRKQAELALRTSEAKFKEIFETIEDLYYETDSAGIITILSPSLHRLGGWNEEDLIGQPATKVYVNPNDRERLLLKLSEKGYVHDYEVLLKTKDGEELQASLSARLIIDNNGRPTGIRGLLRDITNRKKMEESLAKSEDRYRLLFNNISDAVFVHEFTSDKLPGRFIEVNDVACKYLGYSRDELLRMSPIDIDAPEGYTLVPAMMELLQAHKQATWEGIHINKDGQKILVEINNHLFDLEGKPTILSTVRNITERKNAEKEKALLESRLIHSQKMEAIGTLAGGVAHDFNNILTALMGYTSLLQAKMEESDPRKAYVRQILILSDRAAEVTKSLLTFGRKQRVSCKPLKVNDTIRETVNLLTRLLNEDIIVKVALSTKNPTIMADATQIHQILINLATNARDAMQEGGTFSIKSRVVSLSDKFRKTHGYGEPGTYVLIMATDTGTGMNEMTKARIFEPFFTTKELGKGTGLGLASVYGIVTEQKGYITVDSEPGHGTTFRMYFPSVKHSENSLSLQSQEIKRGSETILVVEDNPDVRGLVTEILQEHGYTTLEAADGEDAIRIFTENHDKIDLVIIDVVLPKKNGREVYEEIVKANPRVKTLFTSGHTDDIILEKGIEDGSFEFIAKPLLPDDLLLRVRKVLDR